MIQDIRSKLSRPLVVVAAGPAPEKSYGRPEDPDCFLRIAKVIRWSREDVQKATQSPTESIQQRKLANAVGEFISRAHNGALNKIIEALRDAGAYRLYEMSCATSVRQTEPDRLY